VDLHHLLTVLDSVYSLAYGIVNAMLVRLWQPAVVCAVYAALELMLPHGRRNGWRSYLRAARFLAAGVVLNTLVFTVATPLIDPSRIKPLAVVSLTPLTESSHLGVRVFGWFLAAFLIAILGNFFYYWQHRAQHAVPLLWRFHKVHHSVREMSATNSYHHFTEDLLEYLVVLVPMAFLLGVEQGPVPWIVLAVARTQGYFIHSNAAINIGPLRYVIGENRFHRLHHSLEPRHFGKNFGTTTPLWDVLFGTAYFPRRGEWPDTGLADVPEPQTVADYVMMPLRPVDTELAPTRT
jgi:sterol desaturase/sphingolipid hydroxylase (fatty acid hydroxylase superfamily)